MKIIRIDTRLTVEPEREISWRQLQDKHPELIRPDAWQGGTTYPIHRISLETSELGSVLEFLADASDLEAIELFSSQRSQAKARAAEIQRN
jgi:hypothetical protein